MKIYSELFSWHGRPSGSHIPIEYDNNPSEMFFDDNKKLVTVYSLFQKNNGDSNNSKNNKNNNNKNNINKNNNNFYNKNNDKNNNNNNNTNKNFNNNSNHHNKHSSNLILTFVHLFDQVKVNWSSEQP